MNTNATLRDLVHAESFVPFVIELVKGRKYRISHPDFISVPAERFDRMQPYVTVYSASGALHSINPSMVARVIPLIPRSRRR